MQFKGVTLACHAPAAIRRLACIYEGLQAPPDRHQNSTHTGHVQGSLRQIMLLVPAPGLPDWLLLGAVCGCGRYAPCHAHAVHHCVSSLRCELGALSGNRNAGLLRDASCSAFLSGVLQAHASSGQVAMVYLAPSPTAAAYLSEWDQWREMGVRSF